MSTIVTRAGKGSALTWTEGDANITNLNNDKLENITNESIGDLSDVDLTGVADGNALVWNNTAGTFQPGAAGASAISDLGDVTITTPTSGQVLTYMPSGQWENQTASAGGATTITALTDVNIPTITQGQVLVWDQTNSQFIPGTAFGVSTGSGGGTSGNVTNVDTVRIPNTLTFDTFAGISAGDPVQFMGTNVTAAGLTISTTYYIWAEVSPGVYEIGNETNTMALSFNNIGTPTDFTFTIASSGSGANLADLDDVNAMGATTGSVLTYDMAQMKWQAQMPSGGASTLNDLTDVNATTPSEGDSLVYTAGQWVNQAPSGGGGGAVTGIIFSGAAPGQTIQSNLMNGATRTLPVAWSSPVADPGGFLSVSGDSFTITGNGTYLIDYDGLSDVLTRFGPNSGNQAAQGPNGYFRLYDGSTNIDTWELNGLQDSGNGYSIAYTRTNGNVRLSTVQTITGSKTFTINYNLWYGNATTSYIYWRTSNGPCVKVTKLA